MNRRIEKLRVVYFLVGGVLVLLLVAYLMFHQKPEKTEHRLPQVQTNDFENIVLHADMPVLVDFYADWCPPCRQMEPILVEFARENPRVKVVQVNVDKSPALARRYEIDSIPTFLVFQNGELKTRQLGMLDQSALKALVGE